MLSACCNILFCDAELHLHCNPEVHQFTYSIYSIFLGTTNLVPIGKH